MQSCETCKKITECKRCDCNKWQCSNCVLPYFTYPHDGEISQQVSNVFCFKCKSSHYYDIPSCKKCLKKD